MGYVPTFAGGNDNGLPPPAEPPASSPGATQNCGTCDQAAAAAASSTSTKYAAQVGPFSTAFQTASNGTDYISVGVSTPGLGAGVYSCNNIGSLDGWSVSGDVSTPGIVNAAGTVGFNSTSNSVCAGVGFGDLNGVGYGVTFPATVADPTPSYLPMGAPSSYNGAFPAGNW
jgi:hypothetical protein